MEELREQFENEIGLKAINNPMDYALWLELLILTTKK